MGQMKGLLYPGGPCRVPLDFILFSLVLESPERKKGRTREGATFLTERLIIISSEEFSFRETPFHEKAQTANT